jgi:hypothetical protein
MTPDESDELTKTIAVDALKYKVDAGKETLETSFSPLYAFRGEDSLQPSRQWEVPQVRLKGNTPTFEVGVLNKSGTRLMFYRGLRPGSNGALYPMGSAGTRDFTGASTGNYSLQWDGIDGLYNVWWKPYLEFLRNTRPVEREVQLSLGDILSLDYKRNWVIDYNKFFFKKITLTVSQKTGIKAAKVSLLKTKL